MDATSVSLVLEKLETALAIAQALMSTAKASDSPDARLTELMATLTAIEQEMQRMRQMLDTADGKILPLTLPEKMAQQSESPYYWEDD